MEAVSISPTEQGCVNSSTARRIASFVALDLESNDLPHIFSKVAITELCMYGFAASELETELSVVEDSPVPKRPRILHKLTLLFNPRQLIHPSAENITGLSNYSLENERHFDENAGNAIISFLKHMQQPVCLVAHNGDTFDFPIFKQTLDKLNLELPDDILCVDSLHAFWGIDEQLQLKTERVDETIPRNGFLPIIDVNAPEETQITDCKRLLAGQLNVKEKVDWQKRNETTPRRPPITRRKRNSSDTSTPTKTSIKQSGTDNVFKFKRALFTTKPISKYPPKGVYKLENLFERHFKAKPKDVHYAEADVVTLMHLMKVYGINFLAFAENHAINFNDIKTRR